MSVCRRVQRVQRCAPAVGPGALCMAPRLQRPTRLPRWRVQLFFGWNAWGHGCLLVVCMFVVDHNDRTCVIIGLNLDWNTPTHLPAPPSWAHVVTPHNPGRPGRPAHAAGGRQRGGCRACRGNALTVVEPTVVPGSDAFASCGMARSCMASTPPVAHRRHGMQTGSKLTQPAGQGLGHGDGAGAVSAWSALSRASVACRCDLAAPPLPTRATDSRFHPPLHAVGAGCCAPGRPARFCRMFYAPGRTPQASEMFRSEAHARTLEAIADTHGEAFYRGPLAQAMAAHANASVV